MSHYYNNNPPAAFCSVMALLLLSPSTRVTAFAPPTTSCCSTPTTTRISNLYRSNTRSDSNKSRRPFGTLRNSKAPNNDDDDDEDESGGQTGMNDAFRQLESLDSLDDDDDLTLAKNHPQVPSLDESVQAVLQSVEPPSLEKEAAAFTNLLQNHHNDDDQTAAYQDVMNDLGGTPRDDFDARTVPKASSARNNASRTSVSVVEDGTLSSSANSNIPKSEEDPEQFMNQAIQEALEEARALSSDPSSSSSSNQKRMSDSILDDEEIMKEIEAIFDQGNEKLLASLEEIRQEQNALAKESAERRVQVAMDQASEADSDTKERLAKAEASMAKQLSRVDRERAEVEKAVAELQKVQADLDAGPLSKLSSNALKPAALAGVLLFSVRSGLDFLAVSGGGIDAEAHMTAALVQAGIAVACGIFLIFF